MEHGSPDNVSAVSLLETKLFVPRWRPGLISRPHLIALLDRGLQSRVTLIAAPAGSGKTTLLAEWLTTLASPDRAMCWVSLDSNDNDPALFWTYLITALHRINADVGHGALEMLGASRPLAIEHILTDLLNDLSASNRHIVLALDDVHVIENAHIHEGLAFLIDNMPDQVHIVLASRSDPPLPLARMRVRGDLNEVRVADLRFSPDETARFFQNVMRLDLSGDEAAALQQRTEGWVAGLQLAALSLRDRDDTATFIQSFTGDDRYIVDYLIDEVLQRQSALIRTFLLRTSIVDRFCSTLCDVITQREDSRQILDHLDRANLFLIPLDNRREWFRYHHLFADVLRNLLAAESPGIVAELHLLASYWFEANNLTAEAIRHALLGGNAARAADLIELTATGMRQQRQEATLITWIEQIHEEERHRRPVLTSVYAALLLQTGQFDRVETLFTTVEHVLANPTPDMVVVDQAEFEQLPAALAVHRSGIALARRQVDLSAQLAHHALTVITVENHLYRGAAESLLGLAAWYRGDLPAAYRSYSVGMESLFRAGSVSDTVGGMVGASDMLIVLGRLRDAARTFQDALTRAEQHGQPRMRGTADMYTGLGSVSLTWNDLEAARGYLAQSISLGEAAGFPQNPWRLLALDADLHIIEGKFNQAIELLSEAELVYTSDFHPIVRPIHAMKARVWITGGDLDQADRWVREHNLTSDDEPEYLREFEHITLARLLLARHRAGNSPDALASAAGLLDRLLISAREGGRIGPVIEILVLRSLVWAEQHDRPSARATLEQALALAEPERYVRVLINEGDHMRNLLADVNSGYARHLLQLFTTSATPASSATPSSLVEPLTARELEILRLIASGLRNEEIADQLYISLATVKRHIANTYGKLQVTHRTEAVAKANNLGLIT